MSRLGPIVIVEDDRDDKEIFESILEDLEVENRVEWFLDADSAYEYLKNTKEHIFIIFSDVNLPGKSGLEFKLRVDLDPDLRKASIPFVFFSTNASQPEVNNAYSHMTVQGFFKKGTNYVEMKEMINVILVYWKYCRHPNN
ncbi:MAG TPA: response regulator [Flavobacterium sp.]|jgi:CheY-like chemotaxis protein